MTVQRASMPKPRTSGSKACSISATPPPLLVELTLTIDRPASASRTRGAVVSVSVSYRPGNSTPSSASTHTGGGTTSSIVTSELGR